MTWIRTLPSLEGPLSQNSFDFTITGLTPSTTYQYRSYFIVDGVEYYGVNTYTARTTPINYQTPTVITNTPPINITTSGFDVMNNTLVSDGLAPIIEYGILYTQLFGFSTDTTLIYGNFPTYVKKDSQLSSLSSPNTFSGKTTGLLGGTNTYYRAFAKNAMGVSYGQIYSQMIPTPPIQVSFLNAIEINNYNSIGTLQFIGHQIDTIYSITFTYYLVAMCFNDLPLPGENFDNETKIEITKNNFITPFSDFVDFVNVEIASNQEFVSQETSPIPRTITINNITDINNLKIKFTYNFDNYSTPTSYKYAEGYVQINSVFAIRGEQEVLCDVVGNNRFTIRAELSSV